MFNLANYDKRIKYWETRAKLENELIAHTILNDYVFIKTNNNVNTYIFWQKAMRDSCKEADGNIHIIINYEVEKLTNYCGDSFNLIEGIIEIIDNDDSIKIDNIMEIKLKNYTNFIEIIREEIQEIDDSLNVEIEFNNNKFIGICIFISN